MEALPEENVLRKGVLSVNDAIAQSVALLSLVLGITFGTSLAASFAGPAAPLSFVLACLGCLCLAYVIIRFARRMSSAGGVYTYIAQGLGSGAGFLGGWMYAWAFALGIAVTLAIASVSLSALLANMHITLDWLVIYCIFIVLLFLFAFFDIRISTRTQLVLAALGVLCALFLAVVILVKGGASGLSLIPFSPLALPNGLSGLFFSMVFSFASFIGFEAAAVLGEETANPRQAIPRAILVAVLVGAVFYVLMTYVFSIGYGVLHAQQWAADATPLDTLATRYVGPVLATILDTMVVVSAFIAALAGLNVTARMLYAMGRDRGLPSVFGITHARYKSPWVSIVATLLLTLALGVTLGRSLGPLTFFGLFAITATQGVLFGYILVAVSGIVFFRRVGASKESALVAVCDIVLPLIAIGLCGAAIYSSIWPVPAEPLNYAFYISAGLLVIGLMILQVLWLTKREQVGKFGKMLGD